MKYALLIYQNEAEMAQLTETEQNDLITAHWVYVTELEAAGAILGGQALRPTMTAKSVRLRQGSTLTTDGPFAETKEQLGGFYLIEAASEAEAIQWAAKIPDVATGTIEIRPVMEFG